MQPRSFASLFAIVVLPLVLLSTVLYAQTDPLTVHNIAQPPTTQTYWTLPDDIPLPTVIYPTPPPTVTVTSDMADGYIFLAPYERRRGSSDYTQYLLIFDNAGEPVYYHKSETFPSDSYHDFKALSNGQLAYYRRTHWFLDETYTLVDAVHAVDHKADFHDITLLPNGNYMLLIYSDRAVDMSQIVEGGDPNAVHVDCHLQEIDSDGNLIFEWRSEEHYEITETFVSLQTSRIDGVHCNSVDVDKDGNLIISSRDLYEVTKIDRQTGQIIWRLGGKKNQFEFINAIGAEDAIFNKQHDARWVTESNLTLFDNRAEGRYSRAVEYEIDEENMTATLVWEYRRTPNLHGAILGNTQRLSNGNTLIGWGSSRLSAVEVTRDGTPLFELSLPPDIVSYRAYRFPWIGQPTTSPDLVVVREIITGTNATDIANTTAIKLAYSWNGATEVAAYEIYGDLSSPPQTLLTTEQRSGFETTTVFTGDLINTMLTQEYNFRVVPLDRNGQPFIHQGILSESVSSDVISIANAVRDMVTLTPTATPTPSSTLTPTHTPTSTPTTTSTHTPTATPTASPTFTPLPTSTTMQTSTASPTTMATSPAITVMPTATVDVTIEATPTHQSTFTPTTAETEIPTLTSTPTIHPTLTDISTSTPTIPSTVMPTATPIIISAATPSSTLVDIVTATPTPTVTSTSTSLPEPELTLSVEVAPYSLDTLGQIQPGDRVVFLLGITNSEIISAFDVQIVGTVPLYTTFDKPFSDPRWNLIPDTPLNAASTLGTCPDGYDANSQCQISVGDMTPGQSINEIRFAAIVDDALPDDVTQLDFAVRLAGTTIKNGEIDVSITSNVDVIIGPSAVDDIGTPTSLVLEENPLGIRLFLPYVSR